MVMHNVEDLAQAVRELPPSSPKVLKDFVELVMAKANDQMQVTSEDVTEIVMNFPGCDTGRRGYLRKVGATPTLKRFQVEVQMFVTALDANEAARMVGSVLDERYRANLLPFTSNIRGYEILEGAATQQDDE